MANRKNRPHRCDCGKSFKSVVSMDQHRRHAGIHLGYSSSAENQAAPPHVAMTRTGTETMGTGTATGVETETGTDTTAIPTAAVGSGGSIQSGVKSAKKKKKKTGGLGTKERSQVREKRTKIDFAPNPGLHLYSFHSRPYSPSSNISPSLLHTPTYVL